MTLPRDLSGDELVILLRRHYGYRIIRQRGSHARLESVQADTEHRVTVPRHRQLSVGTLSGIVSDVAGHFGLTSRQVRQALFGDT